MIDTVEDPADDNAIGPAASPVTTCQICAMESADRSAVVFQDDLWSCEVMAGLDVPGWLVLRARRHALGLPGLRPDELATYGPRARDAVAALRHATKAPTTYVLSFGETHQHFHALLIPRTDDVPPDRRMGAILGLHGERLDRAAALDFVPVLRAAHAETALASQEV